MAAPAQRQRARAAKAARRKLVVAAKKRADQADNSKSFQIRRAAHFPIARCLASEWLFDSGIGHLIVCRSLPGGQIGCAFFLIDVYCLGVKDAFYAETSPEQLEAHLDRLAEVQTLRKVTPQWARKLVRDVVAYADGLGIAPAKDFREVEQIFGTIDADACPDSFTFGRQGRPFFVDGPNETPARTRKIMETLQEQLGDGGFEYLIRAPFDSMPAPRPTTP